MTISYGDKSDEELLYLYGFALGRNPSNTLLVRAHGDLLHGKPEENERRLALLAAKGLRPMALLPAPEASPAPLPAELVRVAECLALPDAEVQRQLDLLEAHQGGDGRGGSGSGRDVAALGLELGDAAYWELFRRRPLSEQMAVLAAAVSMLAGTVSGMEDDKEGTGALERDVDLLVKGGLPPRVAGCVVYRAAQKRVAREWLVRARSELHDVVSRLKQN